MHAWAEVEHKLKYKNKDSVPPIISRKFTTISGLFEHIDIEFQEMRVQVSEYVAESSKKIKDIKAGDSVDINHETLKLYLAQNHSKLVGVPRWQAKSEGSYSEVVQELKDAGYKSIAQIDTDLKKDLSRFKKSKSRDMTSEIGWLRASLRQINPKYAKTSLARRTKLVAKSKPKK